MLITFNSVQAHLRGKGIIITGILHIGAHECEELEAYVGGGISASAIDWVEANPDLVARMAKRGIQVHHAAVAEVEAELPFFITKNGQSSSLLPFGTHEVSYPWCKVVETITDAS